MADVNINAGEITSVRLKETTVPATPAAGYVKLYAKTDGIWFVDDAGAEFGPFLPSTLAAAKGDILAATAADAFGVLTVGANDTVLTADSGEATGLKWAASAAGSVATDAIWDAAGDIVQGTGANTAARLAIGTAYQLLRVNSGATAVEWAGVGRVLISEQTPTGTGTVTWSSIPATYKSLEIECVARSTQASTNVNASVYFNNDTTAGNYRRILIYGDATTFDDLVADDAVILQFAAGTATAGCCGHGTVKIINYAGTTFNKMAQSIAGLRFAATGQILWTGILEWESAAAINRVDVVLAAGNYDTGSTFRLYGVY
jgi:hypothetical protein